MKKKFTTAFLALFVIAPIFALLGCGDVSSYKIMARSSSYGQGTVSGEGTYEENSTVTLKATVTNKNSTFLAWLKQDGQIIANDDNFKIENNDNNGRIVGSTLSFTSSESTRGTYTAVFSESAETMQYVKLDSFRISDKAYDENGNFITNPTEITGSSLNLNVEFSQGVNSSDISTVEVQEDLDVEINQKINAGTAYTLKLDARNACQIRINATFRQGGLMTPANFRNELLLGTSSKSEFGDVIFQNGYYNMVFSFSINSENYYFITTYRILSV